MADHLLPSRDSADNKGKSILLIGFVMGAGAAVALVAPETSESTAGSKGNTTPVCVLGEKRVVSRDGFESPGPIVPLFYPDREAVPGLQPIGGSDFGNQRRLEESLTPDLNGDGRPDVVALQGTALNTAEPPTPIQILFNDGNGGLVDCTETLFDGNVPHMDFVRDIHVADFNGDRLPDLFFSNFGNEGIVPFPCEQNRLLLSTPNGKMVDATDTHLPAFLDASHGSSVADIDNDGDIDIWVNNLGCVASGRSYLMTNDGTGRFAKAPEKVIGFTPFDIPGWSNFIDYDKDGIQDLYFSMFRQPGGESGTPFITNLIVPNDGLGNFNLDNAVALPELNQLCPGSTLRTGAQDSWVGDLNLDGWPDIVTFLSSCQSPMIQVLINNQSGGFVDETQQRIPDHGSADGGAPQFTITDVDGNGAEDIIFEQINDSDGTTIPYYFYNDGTGHFTQIDPEVPFGLYFGPRIIVVDLNDDGIADQLGQGCDLFSEGACRQRYWSRRIVQGSD